MKIAILGAGGMGCTVIKHLKDYELVKGMVAHDVCRETLERVAAKHRIATTDDLKAVLQDPQVKLVFITASNRAHAGLAVQAMESGKAVMCEKPMATTLEDSLKMVELAESRKAFLQIGFELRYSRLYTKVKDWIDAGLLGKVLNTHCDYICSEFHGKNSWRIKLSTGGGMFGEKLSHYVDLPRWWTGSEVCEVHSFCAPNVVPYFEVRDNYHTVYRFRNGAVSQLTFMMGPAATFGGDPLQDVVGLQRDDGHALRYLVVGTKGAAETNVFHRTLKRWEFGDSPVSFTSSLVENHAWNPKEDHSYFHNTCDQTRDIVKRVAQGHPPRISARDAYETMRVCDAAEKSADQGKSVFLD